MSRNNVEFFYNLAPDWIKINLSKYADISYIVNYRFWDRKKQKKLKASLKCILNPLRSTHVQAADLHQLLL